MKVGEEYYDPAREEDILGRNKTRSALCTGGESSEVCGKFVLEGLGPSTLWRERSPMAGDGFLLSFWKKPIWEGVWPYVDPMDSVCLRTAPAEWYVPGKCGPHGELFFFLIQKEPAMALGSESFSSFFDALLLC